MALITTVTPWGGHESELTLSKCFRMGDGDADGDDDNVNDADGHSDVENVLKEMRYS